MKAVNYDRAKLTTINDTPVDMTIKAAERPGILPRLGRYDIKAVDTGANTFTIGGDRTAEFTPGQQFFVEGSTGNDGTYTVLSSTLTSGDTVISVASVFDITADGFIETGNTAVLDIIYQADADESSAVDIQNLAKILVTPTIGKTDGKIKFQVDFTPVNGDGTDGTLQTKTFEHSEVMDAWQSAAGRARQA